MPNRPITKQEFSTFSLDVQTNGTPINSGMGLTTLIDTIMICVPSTAANSVFLGANAGVVITNGIELIAGTTSVFIIEQDGRQLYEIQTPLLQAAEAALCTPIDPIMIPIVIWDVSQMYLVAAAITTVSIAVFKASYT